jgi:hypothetical protein
MYVQQNAVLMMPSCGTVALCGPFCFLADHRATDFTYTNIGGIATRFKWHLSMVGDRLQMRVTLCGYFVS